jgi:hypothetical protein
MRDKMCFLKKAASVSKPKRLDSGNTQVEKHLKPLAYTARIQTGKATVRYSSTNFSRNATPAPIYPLKITMRVTRREIRDGFDEVL